MDTRSALRTALVRGSAFTLVTAAYLLIGGTLGGYLWCVYVGFFLTMAFGAKGEDLPRYLCSFLAGYVWAAVYVYLPELLGGLMPGAAATVVSEFVVTAGLLFLHLRFLSGTWLGKIPAVFCRRGHGLCLRRTAKRPARGPLRLHRHTHGLRHGLDNSAAGALRPGEKLIRKCPGPRTGAFFAVFGGFSALFEHLRLVGAQRFGGGVGGHVREHRLAEVAQTAGQRGAFPAEVAQDGVLLSVQPAGIGYDLAALGQELPPVAAQQRRGGVPQGDERAVIVQDGVRGRPPRPRRLYRCSSG